MCGRTIRVDHVAEYRRPKDEHGNEIIEKGCAPTMPTPSPTPTPSPPPQSHKHKKKKVKKHKEKEKSKDKKPDSGSEESEERNRMSTEDRATSRRQVQYMRILIVCATSLMGSQKVCHFSQNIIFLPLKLTSIS